MELKEMKELVKKEGNFKSRMYKGIRYEIVRYEHLGHLCGYLHYTPKNEEERDIIDNVFHRGITYENDGVIGFDCAHAIDLSPMKIEMNEKFGLGTPSFLKSEYRTIQYVEDILKRTIDKLVDRKSEKQSYKWDFEQLEQIKDQQKEQSKEQAIKEYARLLHDENFVVVSNERMQELKMKELVLSKIAGRMFSALENVTEVIKHD
ncbi:hypothetical protein [Macrococcoides caseolyticum]|uniref:hypothetical protein n=1 Tax=Macrococcoides caseolyticum TaxID=69966 RepID=UPI000C34E56D|nr:hypothetical protein [Macrococcus caseolyticus]PKE47939.1 hypothetical protein CW677_06030 [Macrococcus caseolyticus]PKF14886.1 hypothetical protein CW690_06030 [Macrococcus caseolyticus]